MALVFVRRFRLLVALSVQTNTAMGPLQIFALLQQPHLYSESVLQISRKPIQRNRLEAMNIEDQIIIEEEAQERQSDATFTQEIDGRPYHVRVFFPEGTAGTLQEKIEQLLRMEMMKIADEGAG